jgi:hypothetical protein
MLHVACPDCANPLTVSPESVGSTVTCPACGQSFLISAPAPKPPELVPQAILKPLAVDEDAPKPRSDVQAAPLSATAQGNLLTRPLSLWATACIVVVSFFVLASLELVHESQEQRPHRPTVPAISPEQPDKAQKELEQDVADQPK